jgi:hypothetical protein
MKPAKKWQLFVIFAASVIVIEGAIIIAFAGSAEIQGIGGILKSTVTLAGAQLLALGIVPMVLMALDLLGISDRWKKRWLKTLLAVLIILSGVAVAVEGVALAFVAGSIKVEGVGTFPTYLVGLFAAQLFFLGMVIFLARLQARNPFSLTKIVNQAAAVSVAAEGLIVVCIAAPTEIKGIGGILARTVEWAGMALLLLGIILIVTIVWRALFKRLGKPMELVSTLIGLTVIMGGLALASLATVVSIKDVGGFQASTLMIAGLQLAILGIICTLTGSSKKVTQWNRVRWIAVRGAFVGLLLIPVAVLTVGKVFSG